MNRRIFGVFASWWLLVTAWPIIAYAGPITVFSSGFVVPESITPIPAGFGTLGGGLMVPDAGAGALYAIPAAGGAPVLFVSGLAGAAGIFLPPGYGSLAGDYLIPSGGLLRAVSGSGGKTALPAGTNNFLNAGVAIAPAGFGSLAGNVLIGGQHFTGTADQGIIFALSPNLTLSPFIGPLGGLPVAPFGLAFAPAGFGSVGGDLLATDAASGAIYAVDSTGNVSLFTTVPDPIPNAGLRQLAFAPAGFGSYGGDLFVSVSGSASGRGTSGSVDVLDSSGALIAILQQGAVGAPFDPRGLYFNSTNQLLIANADPSILSAPPAAFTEVPEPSAMIPLALGLFAALAARSRRDSSRVI